MTTLSVSSVYRQNDANSSFSDVQSDSNPMNNAHSSHHATLNDSINFRLSNPNACGSQSLNIPTVNINAAISSSLKFNKNLHVTSQPEDDSMDLLGHKISFHRSPATSLDTLIKNRIEKMPNSLVLSTNKNENHVFPEKNRALLFSDVELLACCRKIQASLPMFNLGLRNAGNTCYLNSVLQCLLATAPLLNYIVEKHNHPNSCVYSNGKAMRRFCVLCALHKLLQEHSVNTQVQPSIHNGNGNIFNRTSFTSTTPSSFVGNVRAVCPNLRPYQQEDAHEFLLGLLSRMEDSVLAAHGKLPRSSMETNVIRRIFGGTTRSEVTCSTCRKVSARNDSWFNLSLDITHARSLQQCLVNYTQPEILHNANAYKCETCNKLRHASRCCRIYRSPPILIIQFNRFSRSHKLDMHIEFPASFNMRPHMTPPNGSAVIYNLFGTLNHEGFSCRSGHYVAFTKRRNQWLSHNDSCVTSTTQDCVLRQSPYLLFYELASPELVFSSGGKPNINEMANGTSSPVTIGPELPFKPKTQTQPISPTPNPSTNSPSIPSILTLQATTTMTAKYPTLVFQPRVLCKPLPLGDHLPKTNGVKSAAPITNTSSTAAAPSSGVAQANGGNPTPRRLSFSTLPVPTVPSPKVADHPPTVSDPTPPNSKPDSVASNGPCKANHRSRSTSSSSDNSSTASSGSVVWVPVTKADLEAPTLVRKRMLEQAAETDSAIDRKRRRKERKEKKIRKDKHHRHRKDSKHKKNRKHRKHSNQTNEK